MAERQRTLTPAGLATLLAGHRRLVSGLALCGLLGVTAQAGRYWLTDAQRFPLEVVQVKGDFRYQSKETLQQVLAEYTGEGFFNMDVDSIRNAVEALPWIASARVRRVWPATLRVYITEHEAVARWNGNGFITTDGEVFFPPDGPAPVALPMLAGPDGQGGKVLESYRRISRTLGKLGLPVKQLTLDRRRAWRLQLVNGVELRLGRQSTGARLQRFVRAYPGLFADRIDALRRVDLRYNNGFSVYWRQSVAGDAAALPNTRGQERTDV